MKYTFIVYSCWCRYYNYAIVFDGPKLSCLKLNLKKMEDHWSKKKKTRIVALKLMVVPMCDKKVGFR